MSKFKTDYERFEAVKRFKTSGMGVTPFAKTIGVDRSTLRDWVHAYDNLDGSFVRLSKDFDSSNPATILSNDIATVKILTPEQVVKKSTHFTRFDHSIVLLEIHKIKITTSLEQTLEILEKYYDRHS